MSGLGGTVFLFSFGVIGTCLGIKFLRDENETWIRIGTILLIVASLALYYVLFGPIRPKKATEEITEDNSRLAIKERKKELTEREKKLSKFYTGKENSDIDEDKYKIDQNSDFVTEAKKKLNEEKKGAVSETGLSETNTLVDSPDFDTPSSFFNEGETESIVKFGDEEE